MEPREAPAADLRQTDGAPGPPKVERWVCPVCGRDVGLATSDLVGPRAASLPGDVIARVAVEDVRFDELLGAVSVIAELGLAVGDPTAGDALQRGEGAAAV